MKDIKILKNINLNKIFARRFELSRYLENGFISNEDILMLSSVNFPFGLKNNESNNFKVNILKELYNCPFLLCDQKVSDEVKSVLAAFLEKRYNMELNELELRFKSGDMSEEEFEFEKEILKFNYYDSSFEGREIYITSLTNNKLKIK